MELNRNYSEIVSLNYSEFICLSRNCIRAGEFLLPYVTDKYFCLISEL